MNRWIVSGCALALFAAGFLYWRSSPRPGSRAAASLKTETHASAHPETNSQIPKLQPAFHSKAQTNPTKAAWDTNFLSTLGKVFESKPIQFKLPDGRLAVGTIRRQRSSGAEVTYVSGHLSRPSSGRFFFQKQTMGGIAGPFVGVVELPDSGKAYRIESAPNGAAEMVERPIQEVLCMELPQPEPRLIRQTAEIPPLNPANFPQVPIPAYQKGIIVLESLAGARPVIYLDFQGGYTEAWGGIAYERSTFTNTQIFEIWRRVAEDYMPFNINVTTDLKVFEQAPQNSRQRVIVTPTDTADAGAGGASYVGSFNWTGDIPCWVFVTQAPKYAAEACAHEAGHSLGLTHEGQTLNGMHTEYFYGQGGTGVTGWAPIMGVAYSQNVSQWSHGEYLYANNPEDQLQIIASQNNVSFRADDTGNSLATSRYLETYSDGTAGAEGVIETTGDSDAFQFTTAGGLVSLRADPVSLGPNLALAVSLYDASDTLVASDDPQQTLWASISTNVAAGTYTFRVAGAGRNDPLTNGFSAYASLGYYSITGQVALARQADRFAIPEYAPVGTTVGLVAPLAQSTDALSYSIVSGNISNTFAIDSSGILSVANNSLLDYEVLARETQRPVQFELLVSISDTLRPSLTETNRRVVVAVTNVNEPPVITGFVSSNALPSFYEGIGIPGYGDSAGSGAGFLEDAVGPIPHFSAAVLDGSAPGTPLGTVLATDPDFHTLLSYSIIAGNSNGMFTIDDQSGTISVAGVPAAPAQNLYDLAVVVSDQTSPLALMATSIVSISVELPYQRGSIALAVYTNIAGTSISDLVSNSTFPRDPAFEFHLESMEQFIDQSEVGTAMRGYLIPPATGSYTFSLDSLGNSELWLSSSTNPADMQRIAFVTDTNAVLPGSWTNYPSARSAPVALSVGYAYYIEARFQANFGSNYLGVSWECETNGIVTQIVPGQYLAPYEMNYVPHPVGFDAQLQRNAIAGSQIGRVIVSDVNAQDSETFAIESSDVPGMFALDSVSGTLSLADPTALSDTNRTHCSLAIKAIDNGTPPLTGTAIVTINFIPAGTLPANAVAAEIWTNIPGSSISNLTSHIKFPQRPDIVQSLGSLQFSDGTIFQFEGTFTNLGSGFTNSGFGGSFSNSSIVPFPTSDSAFVGNPSAVTLYGVRIRGLLTTTNTGPFTFFISSADDSVLLLSTNTNPADACVLASLSGGNSDPMEWNKFPTQQSVPLWMEAGNPCYFEVLSKAGPGPFGGPGVDPPGIGLPLPGFYGHVEVGWTGPGLPQTNVIDAPFLRPVDIDYPPVFADRTVSLPITTANNALVAILEAEGSAADTFAYRILSGNVSNTFSLDPHTGQLFVSDNSSFAGYAVSNFTLAVEAQDSGYSGQYPLKSSVATITLRVVDDSPSIVWSGGADAGNWSLSSNWNGTLPTEHSKLIFLGARQQTNRNDILTGADLVTLDSGGFYIDGDPLVLRAGLLSRGTNTWALDSTLNGAQKFDAASGALTIQGRVHTAGNQLTLGVDSLMIIKGEISGAGGLLKVGSGPLIIAGTNSYSGPTDITAGTVILTETGSLAGSSTLNILSGAMLRVDGSSVPCEVPANQTLTGNGTIVGPITIKGNLTPTWHSSGVPSPQSILFSNKLVLAGNTILTISRSSNLSQSIKVVGEVHFGGTLTVSNDFGFIVTPITFRLFDATNISGSFHRLNLPPGFNFDTSQLTTNGTIRLVGTAPYVQSILPLVYTNGQVIIRFQTSPGSKYVLESTFSMEPPIHWAQFPVNPTSFGGIVSIPYPAPPSVPQRFFRIKAY